MRLRHGFVMLSLLGRATARARNVSPAAGSSGRPFGRSRAGCVAPGSARPCVRTPSHDPLAGNRLSAQVPRAMIPRDLDGSPHPRTSGTGEAFGRAGKD
jgi:hypothetical protein